MSARRDKHNTTAAPQRHGHKKNKTKQKNFLLWPKHAAATFWIMWTQYWTVNREFMWWVYTVQHIRAKLPSNRLQRIKRMKWKKRTTIRTTTKKMLGECTQISVEQWEHAQFCAQTPQWRSLNIRHTLSKWTKKKKKQRTECNLLRWETQPKLPFDVLCLLFPLHLSCSLALSFILYVHLSTLTTHQWDAPFLYAKSPL